jgi:hypothetical protein
MVLAMLSWEELSRVRPDLTAAGRELLYRLGVGLAFLATVRRDGGPRLHPMCPLLAEGGIYAFIIPSPKQLDLHRDGRYSLHCYPPPDNEDAFYISGRTVLVEDSTLRRRLSDQFVTERAQFHVPAPGDDDVLFEFLIDRCLLTRTTGHGDPQPSHEVWVGR